MTTAETVAHLHRAMTYDFRLIALAMGFNTLLVVAVLYFLSTRRK